jgi:hypothetical protein
MCCWLVTITAVLLLAAISEVLPGNHTSFSHFSVKVSCSLLHGQTYDDVIVRGATQGKHNE